MPCCSFLLLLTCAAAASPVAPNAVRSSSDRGITTAVSAKDKPEAVSALRENLKVKANQAARAQVEAQRLDREEKQMAEAVDELETKLDIRETSAQTTNVKTGASAQQLQRKLQETKSKVAVLKQAVHDASEHLADVKNQMEGSKKRTESAINASHLADSKRSVLQTSLTDTQEKLKEQQANLRVMSSQTVAQEAEFEKVDELTEREEAEEKALEAEHDAKLEKMMGEKNEEVEATENLIKKARKQNSEQARKLAQAAAKAEQRLQERKAKLEAAEKTIVAASKEKEASHKKRAMDSLVPIQKQLSSKEKALKEIQTKNKQLEKPFLPRRAELEAEKNNAQKMLHAHTAQLKDAVKKMKSSSAEMLESDRVELGKLAKQRNELEVTKAAVKQQLDGLDSKISKLAVKAATATKRFNMAEQREATAQKKFVAEQTSKSASVDTESQDSAELQDLEQHFRKVHAEKVHKVQALRHELLKLHDVEDAAPEQNANLRGHA